MSKIGGKEVTNRKKICEYLMRYCFDLGLLKQFSFTGVSKNRNVQPKPAFNEFPETIQFLFKVVNRADGSYTMIRNEEYLQKIFKDVYSL